MKSLKIHAENYCSYKVLDVEFDKLGRIFSLSGSNGAGKTSIPKLIPVIRYAEAPREGAGITKFVRSVSTYGDPAVVERMKKAKELPIFKGWEVIEHGQHLYRIIRTYNPNLSKGQHTLELQQKDAGTDANDWTEAGGAVSIGGGVDETQAMIIKLFGPYKAYISSTFMNDGASGLLDTPDDDRDDVARFLLNIDDCETLQKTAGEKRLASEREIEQLAQNVETVRARAAGKADVEQKLTDLKQQLDAVTEKAKTSNDNLREVQDLKDELTRKLADADAAARSVAEAAIRIQNINARAQDLRALIGSAEELRQSADRLKEVRAGIRDQQDRLSQKQELGIQETKLSQTINGEKARIESLARQLSDRVDGLESMRESAQGYSAHIAEIDSDLEASRQQWGDIEAAIKVERDHLDNARESITQSKSQVQQLTLRLAELRDNFAAMTGAAACCPTCERAFADDAERQRLIDKFVEEGKQKKARIAELAADIADREKGAKEYQQAIAALEEASRDRQSLESQRRLTQQRLEQLDAQIREVEALAVKLDAYQLMIAQQAYCQAEREQLRSLQDQIAGVGFDQALYTAFLQEERQLGKVESEIARLERAETDLADLETQVHVEETAKSKKADQAAQRETLLKDCDEAASDLRDLYDEVAKLIRDRESVSAQIAAAEGMLRDAVAAQQELETIEAGVKEKQKQVAVYRILELAYKPHGIPLMQYELCLPALEDKINGSLSVLSPGWSLSITAKINNRGKFMIPIETQNPQGEVQPYLARSKGERRIIALSTLVGIGLFWADRTGAQPQQLFVDETEDGLDEDNMQKFKNTIATMSMNFGQIGIISHRPELQSLAQTQIIVYKDAQRGSCYEIAGTHDRPPRVRVEIDMEAGQAAAFETGISRVQEELQVPRSTAAEMAAVTAGQNVDGTRAAKRKGKRK